MSIIYAFRPRLRSRLTLGGRTFPRKPQTLDGEVSRLPLATYAGILSCILSTSPFDLASACIHCSSTNILGIFPSFGVRFSPDNLPRIITRPVSYYALFEWVAASKPTSWLSGQTHILCHSARTWGPWRAVWAVSLLTTELISRSLTPGHHLCGILSLIGFSKLYAP